MIGILTVWSLILVASLGSTPVAADSHIIDLGTLPGHTASFATAINTAGLVVGGSMESAGTGHAFRWDGAMTRLPPLPADLAAWAFGINDAGQVVGESRCIAYMSHAVRWDGQTVTDLGTLPGDTNSSAFDINTTGAIVGVSWSDRFDGRAVLWESGRVLDLGTPGRSNATAINDAGQIVGTTAVASGAEHAFLWQNRLITDLGTLPGDASSYANDVNDAGMVVGASLDAAKTSRAFLWKAGEGMRYIGTLPDYPHSVATGINDAGHVVGFSFGPLGYRGFLWRHGTMTNLGLLPGGLASVAYDISEDGLIAGVGINSGSAFRAVLWPPLPSDALVVEASASVPMTDVGLIVTFRCNVTGGVPPYQVAWAFGDGDRDSNQTARHAYRDVGRKTATCAVTDQEGSQAEASTTVEVVARPVAAVLPNRTATSPGLPITFRAGATGGTGGYSFEWTFGDGSQGTTGETVQHTYADPGDYIAIVTVRDSVGGTGLGAVTIRVDNLVVIPAPPPTSAETGQDVSFMAIATGGAGGYVFRWDFGDGQAGDGATLTHAYDRIGRYTAKVTVTDEQGVRSESMLPVITVREPAQVALSGPGGTPMWVLVVALLLTAVAAAVAVYLAKRQPPED